MQSEAQKLSNFYWRWEKTFFVFEAVRFYSFLKLEILNFVEGLVAK